MKRFGAVKSGFKSLFLASGMLVLLVGCKGGPFAKSTPYKPKGAHQRLAQPRPASSPDPTHSGKPALTQVAIGSNHMCAVVKGKIKCWGHRIEERHIPKDLKPVVSIAAYFDDYCAIQKDGELHCWNIQNHPIAHPAPEDLGSVKAVAMASAHRCVIRQDDTVRCWGENDFHQLDFPGDLGTVRSISAQGFDTCAIQTSGHLKCWGAQVGFEALREMDRDAKFSAISLEMNSFWAIHSDDLTAAGLIPELDRNFQFSRSAIKAVSSGFVHTCAIRTDGNVDCWGSARMMPPLDLGPVSAIFSGSQNSCAIVKSGLLKCWGDNDHNQLDLPENLEFPAN